MPLHIFNRKIHYWISVAIALPVIVMLSTGILLQLKKQWSWVQPPELRGTGTAPTISLDQVLARVQDVPSLGVRGWNDINRIDLRPGRGVAKVWLQSGWEAQVDLETGRVLHVAYRRSDLIESIHDGSFFLKDWSKLGIFLPAGVGLLVLWLSGLWLFWTPFAARRRRAKSVASNRAAGL